MSVQPVPPSVDRGRVAWLLAGGAALVGGTLLGWNGALLEAIATPPALVRAALVGVSVVVAGWLIIRAIRRMEDARGVPAGALTGRDLAGLIRGVAGPNGSELSGRNEPRSVRSWSKLAQGATLPAAHQAHARKRFNCT